MAAGFLNGNAIGRVGVDGHLAAGIDADRRLERRLRFHAAVYMMLGASFLVSVAVSHAPPAVHHAMASRRSGAFEAGIGILLWAAAVALALLSFHLRRFPLTALAAARLAQAALRAFF